MGWCASTVHAHPVVQEHFTSALDSGDITPVRGFKAFSGANKVLLDDGSEIDVDAVVFCTGYSLDFGIIPELEMDGSCGLPLVTAGEARGSRGPRRESRLPRLYQMIFPPRWASSVAVLSWMSPLETYWSVCELASMAVAQSWAAETAKEQGLAPPGAGYRKPALLPTEAEMNAEVDAYHAWWRRCWCQEPSMQPGMVRNHRFFRFLHERAGTAMFDNMGHCFSLRGWRLRWKDWRLHRLLARGRPATTPGACSTRIPTAFPAAGGGPGPARGRPWKIPYVSPSLPRSAALTV